MTSTETIAEFVQQTDWERLPFEAVSLAKKHILDGLGVAFHGSTEPAGKTASQYVKELGGKPEAGVIAHGFRTSAPGAALANGIMAHASDYDDYAGTWQGHPTAVILPTVLALGEREKVSGKEVLVAFILGWEIGAKVCIASGGPKLIDIGWHPTSLVGTMGATAAASKILKLDNQMTRMAFGIAASEAGGLRRNFGTDSKPFHAGNAARNGVTAASLAGLGFTADENIMDGEWSFPMVMSNNQHDLGKLTEGLGSPFSIVSPGGSIKPYPSCGVTHRSIDAILYLARTHHLKAEDIAEIHCEVHPMVARGLHIHYPKKGLEGKFSLEYCMAAALLDGEITLRQFTDEKVSSSMSQDMMKRVKWVYTDRDEIGAVDVLGLPQAVTLITRDERKWSYQVLHSKGSPENPMSWEEVVSKFRLCAQSVLSTNDLERVIGLVSDLESLDDIAELTRIITIFNEDSRNA